MQENKRKKHKKTVSSCETASFYKLKHLNNYFACLAYFVLNLSIRPAVSISLDLPV
jgi:hypothetical protein